MTAGQSGDPEKLSFGHLMNKARKLWDSSPQPVKSFPWNRAMENFIQLILDLAVAVVKYLCLPLLAVTSLSEMSYCAHHKKLFLVPFPLLIGVVVAGVLQETILELSPLLKVEILLKCKVTSYLKAFICRPRIFGDDNCLKYNHSSLL